MLLWWGLLSYWLLTIAAAVATHFVPLLAAVSAYGKLTIPQRSKARETATTTSNSLASAVSRLVLSPSLYLSTGRCFTFYYSFATLVNAVILHSLVAWHATAHLTAPLTALLTLNRRLVWHLTPALAFTPLDPPPPTTQSHPAPPVALLVLCGVFQLHFARRLYECCAVHRFSSASCQHVAVCAFGVLFYAALVLSPLIDQMQRAASDKEEELAAGSVWRAVTSGVALIVFVCGSVWQHSCHVTLARLRSSSAASATAYSIPRGGGFTYFLCPHYTAELLIYLAFALLRPCLLQWLALVWTAVNLSITAYKTRQWYASKWPTGKWTRRWTIVPFVK